MNSGEPVKRGMGAAADRRAAGRGGPSHWRIVFSQGCNLRCRYCSTGFGRFGRSTSRAMKRPTWKRLIGRMFAPPVPGKEILLDIQGGEPFLQAEELLAFVDASRAAAHQQGMSVSVSISTNGTLLDKALLDMCFRRRIHLNFSIDGPAEIHDRRRKAADGRGTHRIAMENWRTYRDLTRKVGAGSLCGIQSVYSGRIPLSRLMRYWEKQGETIVRCVVQEPSPFLEEESQADWFHRRKKFLGDFRDVAIRQAAANGVPDFLWGFKGPLSLYELWRSILWEGIPSRCGAGISTIAVDAEGTYYPCEAFIGRDRWRIGDVQSGIDSGRREAFLKDRDAVLRPCDECRVRDLCSGGCPAAGDDDDLVLGAVDGCSFMMDLVEIARETYALMATKGGGH